MLVLQFSSHSHILLPKMPMLTLPSQTQKIIFILDSPLLPSQDIHVDRKLAVLLID
jgi:hypothetical protein